MIAKRKISFIVNPFSGISKKNNIQELIEKNLDLKLFDYDIKWTQYAGHAIELSKSCVEEGVEIVAAVGGDGTVNEVASSLVYSEVALAIIPGGSGNGLSMHLKIGRNISKAIQALNQSQKIQIDTCTLNQRFYINVAGVGFDARVAYLTKENKVRGFLGYSIGAIRAALTYRNATYTLSIDDQKIEGRYLSINVANASMFGYNFTIAPGASLQDGVLDIVGIRHAWKIRYIFSLWRFFTGGMKDGKLVSIQNGKKIVINSEKKMYLHLDGEGLGEVEGPLEFGIVPRSLWVMVGKIES